jgi:outer membrane protein
MRGRGLAALGAALCLAGGTHAAAETLADAIALAYQTNPTLQTERAQLRALDEHYVQARSGYRPQLSASVEADYLKGAQSFFVPIQDVGASVSASQPIYSGGATSVEVRAAEADIAAGRQQLREVETGVLQQAIGAYADVRRDVQALDIAQTNLEVLSRQLAETRARFDVGQVTRTDVAQAEARLAGAQASSSSAKAQLGVSRAAYAAVIGQSPGELAPEPPLPGLPMNVNDAFTVAGRENPNIVAADYAEQSAAARVALAKAAFHPTVALRAQVGETGYYTSQPVFGLLSSGLWSNNVTASAVFTQPLYAGGMNASRVREALETDSARRIAIEAAQRQTTEAVAQAWNQLIAARANTASRTEQVRANEIAYEGVKQEAAVGLRTTLDILNANQELQTAQLALVGARHDEYLAGAAVLSAMGRLEASAIAPNVALYDPQKAFERIRQRGALPWDPVLEGLDSLGQPQPRPLAPTARASPARAGGEVAP